MAADDQNREIVFTRWLDAPRDLVWQVWTHPAHVAEWWGPKDFDVAGCEIDLRVGGGFHLRMSSPDGTVISSRGTFMEVLPPKRFVLTGPLDADTPCGAGVPPNAIVTLSLDEKGGRTKLTLHTRFETETDRRAAEESGFAESWPQSLTRIAEILSIQMAQ